MRSCRGGQSESRTLDFDTRNLLSAGITYDVPAPNGIPGSPCRTSRLVCGRLSCAHSALPVEVYDGEFFTLKNAYAYVRPDLIRGNPLYLYGSQYPGGKAFDPAAFAAPPTDSNGDPSGRVVWAATLFVDSPLLNGISRFTGIFRYGSQRNFNFGQKCLRVESSQLRATYRGY